MVKLLKYFHVEKTNFISVTLFSKLAWHLFSVTNLNYAMLTFFAGKELYCTERDCFKFKMGFIHPSNEFTVFQNDFLLKCTFK